MKEAFLSLTKKEKYIIGGLGLAGLILNPWSVPIFFVCLWSWLRYPRIKWYFYLLPVLCLILLTMVLTIALGSLTPGQALTTPGFWLASYFVWFYQVQFFFESLAKLHLALYLGRFINPTDIASNIFVAFQGMLTYWAVAVLFIGQMRERGGYRWWVSGN